MNVKCGAMAPCVHWCVVHVDAVADTVVDCAAPLRRVTRLLSQELVGAAAAEELAARYFEPLGFAR